MNQEVKKQYWADEVAECLIKERGKDNVIALETGITPSGPFHMGHLREMIVTDAVRRALEKRGVKTRFIYFVDDLDNLRKLYPFLAPEFEEHVGKPISQIPAPDGSPKTYADYFLTPFRRALEKLGIGIETLYAHKYYESGKMTEAVTQALEHRDAIAEILTRITKRELPEDWQPFEPLDATTGKIRNNKITAVDTAKTRVQYVASNGEKLWADYSKGEGKLPWRVDWAARWSLLDIGFEPFGKDHAVAGGSYDTGREIVEKVYGKKPPAYEVYEHIYLAGERKKMSASLGNLVPLDDFLKIVPPPVARYFVLRSRNERHLVFDPGKGLMQLTDEFARLESKVFTGEASEEEKSLMAYSQVSDKRATIGIPFSHLVTVVQAACGDFAEIKRQLEHTGHLAAIEDDGDLRSQIARVERWLMTYAPEDCRFAIVAEAPPVDMQDRERDVLRTVKDAIEAGSEGQDLHNAIYEAGKAAGLAPRATFEIIYKIFIGKTSGPKAGFFLSMLDREFILERLGHYIE